MGKQLIHVRSSLILIKPSRSGQDSQLENKTVTLYLNLLSYHTVREVQTQFFFNCKYAKWILIEWQNSTINKQNAFLELMTDFCSWMHVLCELYLSLFSSAWYILSQESGTFWLLQGRLLLLLTLFLRLKLLLRTGWLSLAPLLAGGFFPDTQLVNCFRGAPSDIRESIF